MHINKHQYNYRRKHPGISRIADVRQSSLAGAKRKEKQKYHTQARHKFMQPIHTSHTQTNWDTLVCVQPVLSLQNIDWLSNNKNKTVLD